MLFGLDICVLWSFKYFKDVLYNNKNVCGTARCLGTTASTGWEFFHCVVVFCTFHCDAQLWPTILCRLLLQIECKNSHRWWNNRFFGVGSFFFFYCLFGRNTHQISTIVSETDIPDIKLLILLSQQMKWQLVTIGKWRLLLKHTILHLLHFKRVPIASYILAMVVFCIKNMYSQLLVLLFRYGSFVHCIF